MNKIEKLNELNTLLKSGVINNEEFNKLKEELLKEDTISISSVSSNSFNINKPNKKVFFKSFKDSKGNIISTPQIEYLDIDNIPKNELNQLRKFIESKLIFAGFDMTKDEIELKNKLFSRHAVDEIISRREGFNFPLFSVCGIISGLLLIYVITISPCMMYLGGISLSIYNVYSSFFIFSRVASTKYDRIAAGISIVLLVIAWVYYGISWQETLK